VSTAVETMAIVPEPGEASAVDFAGLVAAEQGALLRLALRFCRDPEEARDLVQAALADAYERRRSLRDPVAAPSWLRRILVTRVLNHLRRRRVWRRVRELLVPTGEDVEPADPAPAADVTLARRRRLAAVSAALDDLPARQAAAFTLRYLEGLDLDEVARAMGAGRGTVRTHLRRALVALRGVLSEEEEGQT